MTTLEDKMMDALINDRVEFVDLLLEKGVSMRKFLTPPRLIKLFKEVTRQGMPSRATFEEIVGKSMIDEDFEVQHVKDALWLHLRGACKGNDDSYLVLGEDPFQALLLWSVLCNMQKMAIFMWQRGNENLSQALIAAKLYSMMAKLTKRDDSKADVTEELKANFEEFKKLSLGYLDQCFRANKDRTKQLLIYDLEDSWGVQNCLSLAYAIKHEEFIAHVCCQSLLTEIWTGYMKTSQNSSLKVILGLLIPTTVLSLEFHLLPPTSSNEQMNLGKDNPAFSSTASLAISAESEEKKETREGNFFSADEFDPNILYRGIQKGSRKLTWRQKFIAFYNAPATKFWANVFDYLLFLALFSYVVLVRQDKIPSIVEIVLIIFVCTLCFEEIRQIFHSEAPTFENKFKEWASSHWNRLDGLAVVLFFVGLGLRLYPPTRSAGHVVYCFDVAIWIMRLMHFFYVSKHMGPYVVMIGRMTVDLLYFLFIMVVFFLAYGIPQQAILYPNEDPSWSMASRVFFRPYFQAHGELFLDAPDIIENTTTVFGTPRKDGHGDTVVSFMTAIYLLIVNILLLNLLIAIFNNTYEKVQTNAKQIWMFERYYLVTEYKQRPVLIPPFIILNHLIHVVKFICRCCFNKCCKQNGNQGKSYDGNMKIFEERCVDEYLREKNVLLRATQEEQIRMIGNSMGSVSSQLQDLSQFVTQRFKKIDEDHSKLSDKQQQLTAALETKQSSLTSRPAEGHRRPSQAPAIKTASKNSSNKVSREQATHGRARQSPYPKSSQQRSFVPDSLVAWQEAFLGYDPPSYTAKEIQASATRTDPDIMDPSNTSVAIKFNCDEDGVNRRSHCGEIEVVNRLPRNPVGRTGITGRGLFGQWGPNHAAYLIITRWKMGENGKITQKKGKNVLEFLALKRPNNVKWTMRRRLGEDGDKKVENYLELIPVEYPAAILEWAIPGGMIEVGDSVPKALMKSIKKKVLPTLNPVVEGNLEERLHTIIHTAEEVYKGYMDDPRNTDNAWMETVTMNFHDETREILGDFEFEANKGAYSVNWKEVSSEINLQDNQSFILHKVAESRNAYF